MSAEVVHAWAQDIKACVNALTSPQRQVAIPEDAQAVIASLPATTDLHVGAAVNCSFWLTSGVQSDALAKAIQAGQQHPLTATLGLRERLIRALEDMDDELFANSIMQLSIEEIRSDQDVVLSAKHCCDPEGEPPQPA